MFAQSYYSRYIFAIILIKSRISLRIDHNSQAVITNSCCFVDNYWLQILQFYWFSIYLHKSNLFILRFFHPNLKRTASLQSSCPRTHHSLQRQIQLGFKAHELKLSIIHFLRWKLIIFFLRDRNSLCLPNLSQAGHITIAVETNNPTISILERVGLLFLHETLIQKISFPRRRNLSLWKHLTFRIFLRNRMNSLLEALHRLKEIEKTNETIYHFI